MADLHFETRLTPYGWMFRLPDGHINGPFESESRMNEAIERCRRNIATIERVAAAAGGRTGRRSERASERQRRQDSQRDYEAAQAQKRIMWDAIP